jgi:signal transduction histidine kinase
MDLFTAKVNPSSIAEKEKYFRFERISELFTYLGLFGALFLSFLPFDFPINKNGLYILFAFVFCFCFVWFRLVPKKYTGLVKTLIYYYSTLIFVFIGVHFTQGIQSFAIFYFYLTVLGAGAALRVRYFFSIILIIAAMLLLEAFLFPGNLTFSQSMTLAALHIWSLFIVALFAKSIFDEEVRAEAKEESTRLRAAKQIDTVKNEFVFIISNKLKQPILTLQNHLDSLLKTKNQNWTQDFLELVNKTRENSQRLSSLVNDLSDLSRIETQKLRLDLKEVNLNQLIGSTLSDFSMTASEKNINLTYEPNTETVIINADPSRMHEILANLIDNAVKYSPSGTTVIVRFKREGNFAQIEVKDSGYGIPEEAKIHLFEKFYRVNRSSSEPKGTGLGLFVTKELIERQGGKIWFDSQVGRGTTFYFTLPLFKKDGNK